jgi:hypothetical protein
VYFSRDDARGPACLEFSWVPTGQRQPIMLPPGVASGSKTLAYSGVSQVQIYKVVNNGLGFDGDRMFWQFPPGPAYASSPTDAFVTVLMSSRQVVGSERYADLTVSPPDARGLTLPAPICPPPEVRLR